MSGDGFWLGMALALPVYFVLDRYVIPWLVDRRGRGRA
jgi:hypothetical protein